MSEKWSERVQINEISNYILKFFQINFSAKSNKLGSGGGDLIEVYLILSKIKIRDLGDMRYRIIKIYVKS